MTYIQNKFGLAIIGALLLTVAAALASVTYGGPLDPPAPLSSTDKTLISSLPYTISTPGSYIVKSNLSCVCGGSPPGITINASQVTLDLNGFSLSSTGSGSAIEGTSALTNITIENGSLAAWTQGITLPNAQNVHVHGVTVDAMTFGIYVIGSGVIEDCSITGASVGVTAVGMTVSRCTAKSASLTGIGFEIDKTTLTDCVVMGFGTGIKPNSSIVSGCVVTGVNTIGIQVSGLGAHVTNNTVKGSALNNTSGIKVSGEANVVENNTVTGSAYSTPGAGGRGIWLESTAKKNTIDGNSIYGFDYALFVAGANNLVVRNDMSNSLTGNSLIAGNTYGPLEGPGAPVNPWANINH
jgi:hypothetical protein